MSEDVKECPKCQYPYCYFDSSLWICPECSHEWNPNEVSEVASSFQDAFGAVLENGDSVKTIKELKVGKSVIKSGTKVKNIRLLDVPVNDHDISCKIDGIGQVYLKCSVVKKA
ncbi:MAG: alkylphosphonate utilization protein [Halobacteriovoraceae bacterium]|nr:alkylphosphonate utilization protein [Halobacteriovoraceae bacterium]